MTVSLIANDCKYETEAVIKLFFPLMRFSFVYDSEPSGPDNIILSAKERIFVRVSAEGRTAEDSAPLPDDGDIEGALCRMLFRLLCSFTATEPEWGCLTGIRPVKKINELSAQGLDDDSIKARLKEKYFISDKKFELALRTARTQRHALDTLDERNSFSLYIGIPFCPSRCSYCSFVSHSITSRGAHELIPQYVDKLCEEIEQTAEAVRRRGCFCDTVYFGGGTPTAIDAAYLDRIMKTVGSCFDLSKLREYTVEAGRPDTVTAEKLAVIRENGADRISVNPQTLSDDVLRNIGRIHTSQQFYDAFELARKAGFDNINCDTIAGLPGDTYEGFCDTLSRLTALSPECITVHTLTVKRSARLFGSVSRDDLAADEILRSMVDHGVQSLVSAGYEPYYLYRQKNTVGNLENVGYARPGRESLYNIYIMEERQNIIACGCGGSTKLTDPDTGKITRYFNYKYPYEYISRYDRMTGYKALI